jgi:hypothetical protein
MYLELGEELIKKVQAVTCTDCRGEMMPTDNIIPLIKDLLAEIDRLKEEIEDLKEQNK